MAYDNEDWIKAITRLIELTSREEIKWNVTQTYDEDVWTEVDRAYETEIKSLRYVVKEIRRKNYLDEHDFYWANGFSFEIYKTAVSGDHVRIATAPSLDVIGSLFSVIEDSYAYQEGALSDLLGP